MKKAEEKLKMANLAMQSMEDSKRRNDLVDRLTLEVKSLIKLLESDDAEMINQEIEKEEAKAQKRKKEKWMALKYKKAKKLLNEANFMMEKFGYSLRRNRNVGILTSEAAKIIKELENAKKEEPKATKKQEKMLLPLTQTKIQIRETKNAENIGKNPRVLNSDVGCMYVNIISKYPFLALLEN